MTAMTAAAPAQAPALTAQDRCDRCGAQAYVRIFIGFSDLLFCGHHYRDHEDKILKTAAHIHSELRRLDAETAAATG